MARHSKPLLDDARSGFSFDDVGDRTRWQSNPKNTMAIDWVQNAGLIPLGIILCFEGLWTSQAFEYFIF